VVLLLGEEGLFLLQLAQAALRAAPEVAFEMFFAFATI